ncbi:DEAD/DEAH box helicase [Mammaliicoccus sciuri]|uniref:ATP-dependent DNA helicase n=1 Tax=Mammaliicoccus sciuri TaxID=1296 RepID=UPI0021D11CAB|nr:helicase C-terminal domain-containing protein [Mammaliicoccus sciuri]UXU83931.1 DEAD/DEAH box helicase [Mammaliicoccus sciuri]UXU93778.1 DEAD/DEAH box helicase [Mammaliicoccus sciuri]UXV15726.1 DEAD/DEAH box helicase [Mammaliicoccus sciuri]UXV23988.1 DEAD/DEAH box helicase [Mammaliicoccus sciuri]UXV26769.1 DEAD/DEAH box helicase [Mammaliicoccus sciuri]
MNYQKIYQEIFDALQNMKEMGMETRVGQENLMYNVFEAFEKNENIIVEAQVGIGKSLGYLIPGILISIATNRPLIVASSTIQLTEQLARDIKLVEKILSVEIEFIIGKGVTNYPCFKKIHDNLKFEKLDKALDIAYNGLTKQEVHNPLLNWNDISTNRCLYEKCIHSKDCSFLKMREQMLEGNIYARLQGYKPKVIIVNHNLLLHHYKNKMTGKNGLIYDHPCLIVIDEVHNLEENQRSVYTTTINSDYCIKSLRKALNKINHKNNYSKSVDQLASWFNKQLNYVKSQERQESHDALNKGRMEIDKSNINALKNLISSLFEVKEQLEFNTLEAFNTKSKISEKEIEELECVIKALEIIDKNNNDYVIWSELLNEEKINICYCPSDPSEILRKSLFNGDNLVACFSATIINDSKENDGYNYIIESIGFKGYYENVEKNDFLYDKSRLYIPSELPNYKIRDKCYYKELAKYIFNVSSNNSGGTMVLFTAKEDITRVAEELKKLNVQKCIYMDNGEMSQNEIIKQFQTTHGIILGTGVFWEGIDLKEKDLTSLVIVRLPFPVPDPVIERKIEILGNKDEVLVPEMIMKLKQGTGRLIRTANDIGLLTILDSRMNNKNYPHKEAILNSIPIKKRINDSEVFEFLNTL